MEVFTLIIYAFDIVLSFKLHKEIKQRLNDLIIDDPTSDKHLWRSVDDERKLLRSTKIYITLSIVALLPFSIFFYIIDVNEPLLVIFYLKMLRLAKFKPFLKVFDWFKQRTLNFTRIAEMLFIYYCASHIAA